MPFYYLSWEVYFNLEVTMAMQVSLLVLAAAGTDQRPEWERNEAHETLARPTVPTAPIFVLGLCLPRQRGC